MRDRKRSSVQGGAVRRPPTTLVELVRERAETHATRGPLLGNGVDVSESMTFAQLDEAARKIAVELQSAGIRPGARAPPLHARPRVRPRVLRVRPRRSRRGPRAHSEPGTSRTHAAATADDRGNADLEVGLTSSDLQSAAAAMLPLAPELASQRWIATDRSKADAKDWTAPPADPDAFALLQYTSGSTGNPRPKDVSGRRARDRAHVEGASFIGGAVDADRPLRDRRHTARAVLFLRRGADDHTLLFAWHQLVHDETDGPQVLSEVLEVDAASVENRAPRLPELKVRYGDYTVWERAHFEGVGRSEVAAAIQRIAHARPPELPTDRPRKGVPSPTPVGMLFGLGPAETTRFLERCKSQDVTFYAGVVAPSPDNRWQISQPQKTLFCVSRSEPKLGRMTQSLADIWSGYEPADPKLIALYSKGKSLQWDAAKALDWSAPIDPSAPVHAEVFPLLNLPILKRLDDAKRDTLTAYFTEQAISQFLHGEQGALMVAARLVDVCPDYEAKLYAATQTMDEARHLEVFASYLKRSGTIHPVVRSLRSFLESILGADHWVKLLIGMQVIVEGAALTSFHAYRERARDPLLSALLDGVIRDEARHVGFGTLYVQRTVAEMKDDEREEIADFAFNAVMTFSATRRESLRNYASALENVGLSIDDVLRDAAALMERGDAVKTDSVRDGISDFILPTLRRLGLLTPRIQKKFSEARLPAAPTSPLLEQLQDLLERDEVAA
jgi:rubrerythrin